MKQNRNYYQILGVQLTASPEEIRLAYKTQAQKIHPDRNPSESAHDQFIELEKAYRVLSDPGLAKMYRDRTVNRLIYTGESDLDIAHRVWGEIIAGGAPLDFEKGRESRRMRMRESMNVGRKPTREARETRENSPSIYAYGDEFSVVLREYKSQIPNDKICEIQTQGAWATVYYLRNSQAGSPYILRDVHKAAKTIAGLVSAAMRDLKPKQKKNRGSDLESYRDLLLRKEFLQLVDKGALSTWELEFEDAVEYLRCSR